MTVAGIELRKALDHLCTTPESTAAIEDFINAFRGLASSQRLGVSPLWRSTERAAILAPQYNRAIAALLFDLVKFGGAPGVAGTQARRSLALGIAAISAASVGISIAAGESMQEAVDHLNPASRNFMTWDVAGQKVGPGSKIRSLLAMLGQIIRNPGSLNSANADELLSYNPLVKFVRGNLSGGAGTALDIITGKDYIGDPTRQNILQLSKEVFAQNLVPLWIQSATMEGGTAGQRGIQAAGSFMGLRTYIPKTNYNAQLTEEVQKLFPSAGSYYDLNFQQRDMAKNNPKIKLLLALIAIDKGYYQSDLAKKYYNNAYYNLEGEQKARIDKESAAQKQKLETQYRAIFGRQTVVQPQTNAQVPKPTPPPGWSQEAWDAMSPQGQQEYLNNLKK